MVTDSSGETDDDGIEMAASSSSFTVSCEDVATLLYYRQERSVDMNTLGKTEKYLKECDLGVFFKTHPFKLKQESLRVCYLGTFF